MAICQVTGAQQDGPPAYRSRVDHVARALPPASASEK